ncbi:MAG TPA: hypothetical protein VFR51_18310 [Pyrinomonadaceae bacterium]|nr:hypothetical protein [Pyrinomonadaceae bacterium]
MWICLNCKEEVEEQFGACWNCEADRQGRLPKLRALGRETAPLETAAFLREKHRSKRCLRCNVPSKFAGTKEFHEGPRLGVLGDFGELFVTRTRLEMYVCPKCLAVEFFASDQGDAS